MGKKVKKKAQRLQKEKRAIAPSPKAGPEQCDAVPEVAVDGGLVAKGRPLCIHIDKGISLSNVSERLGSSDPIRCEDCREDASDRRGGKGKGKNGKKKGGVSVDSKSDAKAMWICLACGHFSCGGVGLPTTAKSHAVRHSKLKRHPLVIQIENPNLRWCFSCNVLIPVEKTEDSGEKKDVFSEIVKLIKGRAMARPSVDVEDVWFGSGSILRDVKSENTASSDFDGKGGHVVRGLVNLGNTCFFNSVMQNLLSLNSLRDHFLGLDGSFGPLTIALKKLFIETTPEGGFRGVVNPKSFFGSLCAKAPQFRGYQQHDSHELLRCLLDGLSTENLSMKKQINSFQTDEKSLSQDSTIVDVLFGGETSSTVCCLECGHSSTVYEPFLDLSLPVPTKKHVSKKAESGSRAKKMKLPPKRGGRARAKYNKDTEAGAHLALKPSVHSPSQVQPKVTDTENVAACSSDSMLSDMKVPAIMGDVRAPESENSLDVHESGTKLVPENAIDQPTWLDYIDPEPIAIIPYPYDNDLVLQDLINKDPVDTNIVCESGLDATTQVAVPQNSKSEPSSENICEDVELKQVNSSEVILLPYKQEVLPVVELLKGEGVASTSVVSMKQDLLEFEGFGGLFDEPEATEWPDANNLLGANSFRSNECAAGGWLGINDSESEPDEVDDTSSPVSVESCLAFYTKPELLTKEQAWICESCSKRMKEEKMETRKNKLKIKFEDLVNGYKDAVSNESLHIHKEYPGSTEVKSIDGNCRSDFAHNALGRNFLSEVQDINDSTTNCAARETNHMPLSKGEIGKNATEPSQSSNSFKTCSQASLDDQVNEVCSYKEPIGCDNCHINGRDSQLSAGVSESGDIQGEEMDSKSMKVKRDATIRVLINKAPPILTIHLKRFTQDGRGRLSKLSGHVDFGVNIDLHPYMDPRHQEDEDVYNYRLNGVVEHSGSMRQGHYVAYVRSVKKSKGETGGNANEDSVWYHISDAYVREVALDVVLRAEAYILFYERV